MSQDKKRKYVVNHPRFYLAKEETTEQNGKNVRSRRVMHIKKGDTVMLTEAQAEKHKAKLLDPAEAKTFDDGKEVAAGASDTEAAAKLQAAEEKVAELEKQNAELAKTVKSVDDLQKQVDALDAEATELKAQNEQLTAAIQASQGGKGGKAK